MSPLQIAWLISIFLISTCKSQTNQYKKENGTNGEDIWKSTSDFIPVQSQSFGTIKIGQVMSMEFDFMFGGRTNDPQTDKYEMFFRVGFDASGGNGCPGQGARYPSFWINQNSDTMHVSLSNAVTCQPQQSLSDYGVITKGVWYHVKIAFNETQLVVNVTGGGRADWGKVWNRTGILSEHIGVAMPVWWMSNKYSGTPYNRGNGTFSNVTIISDVWTDSPTYDPTMDPTIDPTSDPTPAPTTNPTPAPTGVPTIQPTLSPITTLNPSKMPTASPVLEIEVGVGEPTISPTLKVGSDGDGSGGKTDDSSFGGIDGTFIGIIIAAVAVCCCIVCGICILCRNKKLKRYKSSETPSGYRKDGFPKDALNLHSVQTHSNQKPKDIAVQIQSGGAREGDNKGISTPYTPDGPDGEVNPVGNEFLSDAQKQELHRTPQGPEEELYTAPLHDDDDMDIPNAQYLSQAQREELVKVKQTPFGLKYSDTAGSDAALMNGRNDEFVIAGTQNSDDEVVVEMQTAGYIGDEEPELPPSKKQKMLYLQSYEDKMSQDIVEHMDTIGADDDVYNDPNQYDDDEYDEEYDDEMAETIQ